MQGSTESISVLHVDDNQDFAEMTATFLEREDNRFDIETATNSREALNTVAEHDFDCIISDYDMPDHNGIEFLQKVRESYPDLPFILFTGKGSEAVASDAIFANVSDYLQKEGGTDQYIVLANRMINLVDKYRLQSELDRHTDHQLESEQYHRELLKMTADPDFSPQTKTHRLLELTCEFFDTDNGHLVKIDPINDRHKVISIFGSDIVQKGVTDLSETYCRKTIESDELLEVYNAPEQGWKDDPAYERFNIGCYIGKKLLVEDGLYGTVCTVSEDPRSVPFTTVQKTFFDLMSQSLHRILERSRQQAKLETLFEQNQDTTVLFNVLDDGTLEVRRVNHTYADFSTESSEDLTGRSLQTLLDDERRAEFTRRYRTCLEQRAPVEYEGAPPIPGADGQWRTKLAPIIENDEVVQLLGTMRQVGGSTQNLAGE